MYCWLQKEKRIATTKGIGEPKQKGQEKAKEKEKFNSLKNVLKANDVIDSDNNNVFEVHTCSSIDKSKCQAQQTSNIHY